MNKRFGAFLAGLALAVLFVAPAMAQDTIKVGIILPLTGSQASFGEIEKNSFDMALEAINAAGGVNGTPLEFIYEDDTGRPEVGSSAAEKLITQDNVVMLGGGYSSSVCANVASTAESNSMPFLINTGSADDITEHGYQYVFRLNPPASEYPNATKEFLEQVVQPQTCAILFENSNFGTSSSEKFKELCEQMGIEVVLYEGYEHGAVDFKPLLIKVKAANPDIIYMVSYVMDASLIMKQAAQLQITPKAFIGGGAGFTLPEFLDNAGSAAEKVFSATLWYQTLPYEGAQEYYDAYMERFGSPTEYHGAEAYAAAYVIADVLSRAASFSNEDIRIALSETDMMTVFGPVKFVSYDNKTNQNSLPTYLVQWIDGKLELVWPTDVQSAPYVYPVDWAAEWSQ